MKKIRFFLSLLMLTGILVSCNTKVDLYADYKDIPIVYGLLDATIDTNYVKIVRAFSGSDDASVNAEEVALIADSCNYPGKLDARIFEYVDEFGNNNYVLGRTIVLDTMTIDHKDPGTFYYPNQKVYWTAEHFNVNGERTKYKYRLQILKGNDTITSETGMVGGERFRIATATAFFMDEEGKSAELKFIPADNAAVYYMSIRFNYHEVKNGQDVLKSVSYTFPALNPDNLVLDGGAYVIGYQQILLFNLLRDAIGSDTIHNTNNPEFERYFDEQPLDIMLAAGGDELYNYIQVNSVSGYSQTVPDYTNINGGYGVFSSRINLLRKARISARAESDLYGKTSWGFVQH